MYVFDPETLTLAEINFVKDESVPAKRNSHAMVCDEKKQVAYIFGGANSSGPLGDLWQLDLTSNKFKRVQLEDSEEPLPAIEMHTAHLINDGKTLLVIGGRALPKGTINLNEIQFSDMIYAIDLEAGKVSKFGSLPSALGSHVSAVVDDKYIVLYGGTNGYRFFDSILRYEISTQKWTLMTKIPASLIDSVFFKEGRIAASYC